MERGLKVLNKKMSFVDGISFHSGHVESKYISKFIKKYVLKRWIVSFNLRPTGGEGQQVRPSRFYLTLLLVGFLEYVNWWGGGGDSALPSDLEN